MPPQISNVTDWRTLKCSVQDCQNKPEIGLEVKISAAHRFSGFTDDDMIPTTGREDSWTTRTFTPCVSDKGIVLEYLEGKGFAPTMVTEIPRETLEGYVRHTLDSIAVGEGRESKHNQRGKEKR